MNNNLEHAYKIYSKSIQDENYEPAFSALNKLIREQADAARALQLRAHLYQLSGKNDLAKHDLDAALKLNPSSGGLYYDRGALLHLQGQYYAALQDFCEAVNCAQALGDDDLIDAAEHHFIEILDKMRSR